MEWHTFSQAPQNLPRSVVVRDTANGIVRKNKAQFRAIEALKLGAESLQSITDALIAEKEYTTTSFG